MKLLHLNTLLAVPLSSSNKSYVQLTRMNSTLVVLMVLSLLYILGSLTQLVSVGSTLAQDVGMTLAFPALHFPKYIDKHVELHVRRKLDNMRYKYNHVPIVYGIVCNPDNCIYVGST
jgi:hypothetical protein